MAVLDRIRATVGALAFRADALVPSFLTGDLGRRWLDRPGALVVAAILGLVAASFLALAAENASLATSRSLAAADVTDVGRPSRERAIVSGDLVETWLESFLDADLDGYPDPEEPTVGWSYLLVDHDGRHGVVVLSGRQPATVLHDEAAGVVRREVRRVEEHQDRLDDLRLYRELDLTPGIVIDASAKGAMEPLPFPADGAPSVGMAVRVSGTRFSPPVPVCGSFRIPTGSTCPGGRVLGWDRILVDEASGTAVVVFQVDRPPALGARLEGLLVARPAEVRSTLDAWPGLEEAFDVELSRRYVLDEVASVGRPATIAVPLFVAVIAAIAALALVAGHRSGPLVFRVGRAPIAPAVPPADGETVAVRMTGRLVGPNGPYRVREEPAEVGLGPDGRARLAAAGRLDGWDVTPRSPAIETGIAVLPRGARPAIRYAGPDGPIVLTLAPQGDPLTERLAGTLALAARAEADAEAAQSNPGPARGPEGAERMDAHDLGEIRRRLDASGRPYLEFIRSADLSVGLYVLPAGGDDRQQPHTEDEVYHVVSGRATIVVGEERRPVGPGSIVFVAATVPHRFVEIEEELVILVAFGPAEDARQSPSGPEVDAGDVS